MAVHKPNPRNAMDAHALLTSQGWRGKGHSLHSTSDSIGLARPLLVSQKQNTLGVGKKQHRTSDMWWMNAFDKSLKGLDTSQEGTVVQTVTSGALDMVKKGGGKWVGNGGLYSCFVRGETMVGSLREVVVEERTEWRVEGTGEGDRKEEKRRRRREGESKEDRRKRKLEKRARRAAKENTNESTPCAEGNNEEATEHIETKEQRKERRRLKKALKAAAAEESSDTPAPKDASKKKKKRKD